jgi:hypothetical protein
MSTLSIEKSRNAKSAAPKKGSAKSNATSRRKVTSAAANAKTPLKADEPKIERLTKQERVLTPAESTRGGQHRRDDAGNRLAAAAAATRRAARRSLTPRAARAPLRHRSPICPCQITSRVSREPGPPSTARSTPENRPTRASYGYEQCPRLADPRRHPRHRPDVQDKRNYFI